MFVLQQLRDEAHRFAISFHRNSRRRLTLRSALSDIPGIGPGRQRQLLRHFGSVKRVREATVAELAAAPGISPALAEVIHAYWAKQPLEPPAVDAHASSEELAIDDAFSSGGGAVVEMTTEAKDPAAVRFTESTQIVTGGYGETRLVAGKPALGRSAGNLTDCRSG